MELSRLQQARFETEIAALSRIDHPGVVKLLGNGYTGSGEPFLVLPLIEGVSLREYLKSGPMPRRLATSWILQIGEALGAAHEQNVLHRDLKPENILIHAGSERIVIVDFGAATIRDAAAGGTSTLMLGSFDYLAPDQVQGRSSPATDVYYFSAVVFEMLTGVRYRSLSDGSEEGLGRALPGFEAGFIGELAQGVHSSLPNGPRRSSSTPKLWRHDSRLNPSTKILYRNNNGANSARYFLQTV